MDNVRIKLEDAVLSRIQEKNSPFHTNGLDNDIILSAFLDFYNNLTPDNSEAALEYLAPEKNRENFIKELQSYGIINPLFDDPRVEDIIINGTQPIYIHYAGEGLKKTHIQFSSQGELDLLIKKILVFSGKKDLEKINNLDLLGMRGRVNIVYSPLGPQLTIAKTKANPFSIIDLISNGTLTSEMAALFWLYIQGLGTRPANILISGGPGSGKTTLLNALLSFIPMDEHIVIIEDVLELLTSWIESATRLETDEKMSMADLVKNSLRMRPERIIVGEVRGTEAQDMMTAMNIGKYCLATIHASTPREAIIRLSNEPMNVPESLISLIDVFIVLKKIKTGEHTSRVVEEIAETAGMEKRVVLLTSLWKFDLNSRIFESLFESNVYRDKLSTEAGLSGREILEEIGRRKAFLEELKRNNINSIEDVSSQCGLYIRDPQLAVKNLEKTEN